MAGLASLFIVISLSLLVTRIATIALTYTGLSREAASFQARSAFTGVGFTTNEAEQVVSHPVRRRITMLLMLLGNVGIVTSMSSLLLTFVNLVGPREWLWRLFLLALGIGMLWIFGTSQWVDRYVSRVIRWALRRWTRLDVRDYASLLHLSGKYTVIEQQVNSGDWLADRKLADLGLREEGVIVLGIHRDNGKYVGAPKGNTCIRPGDTLILYGKMSVLNELDQRGADFAGEEAHRQAVANQQRTLEKQERQEARDEARRRRRRS
ncbi:MAG: TrkA C-terminal domain-containing protein [Chroococcales cyanobacterium]